MTCCTHLEVRFQECGKKEVCFGDCTWKRKRSSWRRRETARSKKCAVRFSLVRKNRVFQKNYEDRCEEAVEDGFSSRESMGGQAVGIAPTEKVEPEEANGREQQARRNQFRSHFLLFIEVNRLEVEEEIPTKATLAWAERVLREDGEKSN